jgi:signal transduction histidine kinase
VEDYLNISRIEQGRMQYNFSIFDITDTIKNIIKEVQVNIDRAGLTIALHYDQSIAFKVNVDEGKIKQVLFNLIDNASKYTKKGGIDIYVTEAEGDKMRIEIRDTGVGIKPQVLPTLFNKFVRAPDASKANILGTGLGLYVANEIIRAHNGKVWAKSAGEGKGSSFFVELGMVA